MLKRASIKNTINAIIREAMDTTTTLFPSSCMVGQVVL
jgi:hypothetical protein